MEQKFIRAFGYIFTQNTYEQGLKHKLIPKEVITCTIFCSRGYVESTDSETGNRMQDNYAGLLLKASDFVCKEYDLYVTESTVVYCYDELLNDNKKLNSLDDEKRLIMQAFFNLPFAEVRTALNSMVLS